MTTRLSFRASRAVVIGIDAYGGGIPRLRTAVADASRIADALRSDHGYEALNLLNEDVTLARLRRLFGEELPAEVGPDDRVLVYFAGHGIAMDGDDGPAGYLVPQDALRDDRDSFLPMSELSAWLEKLPCRHLLLVLDCCFAGAFRWSSTRDLCAPPEVIYRERFDRFIQDPAWQVITSAAYDQKALDILSGETIGVRSRSAGETEHSPFAAAFLRALAGEADVARGKERLGDGVVTATELYLFIRDVVEVGAEGAHHRQTPGFWPLRRHDKGEYVHLVPGCDLDLPPAPQLTDRANPWRGLQSYDEDQARLFFGRSGCVATLAERVRSRPLTVVLGASGTGKSSVVKAGLLPLVRSHGSDSWQILPPIRPGKSPLAALSALTLPGESGQPDDGALRLAAARSDPDALAGRISAWADTSAANAPSPPRLLLVVDQFEELITLCPDAAEREVFLASLDHALAACPARLRVVVTLRSDFEPQFAGWRSQGDWMAAGFAVPAMTLDEYREAIEGPASVRVLYFRGKTDSSAFIDRLIGDVANTPGALPLLSFALSELYRRYVKRGGDDRSLSEEDYDNLGGIGGALRNRADEVFNGLPDEDYRSTLRRILLRMVSVEGGELARRRVLLSELDYGDDAENARVAEVLRRLTDARLVVRDEDVEGSPFVEPAHDELVRGWPLLLRWTREHAEALQLIRRLNPAATAWERGQGSPWSFGEPRLALLFRLSASRESWMNRSETRFIRFSRRLRQAVIGGTIAATIAVLAVVSALGWRAYASRKEADSKRLAAYRSIRDVSETAIDTFLAMDKQGLLSLVETQAFRSQVLHNATARMGLIAKDLSGDPETLRLLAEEYIRLADLIRRAGDPTEALSAYGLAATSLESLDRTTSVRDADRLRSAFVHNNVASLLAQTGQAEKALEHLKLAEMICEELGRRHPDAVETQRQQAVTYGNMGLILPDLGRRDDAMASLHKAVAIESRLVEKKSHAKACWFLLNLSSTWNNLAGLMDESGANLGEILEIRKRVLTLREQAAAAFVESPEIPARSEFQSALGRGHLALALTLARAGAVDDALKHERLAEESLRKAQEYFRAENSSATPPHAIVHDLAIARLRKGELLERGGEKSEALRSYMAAVAAAKTLEPQFPSHPPYGLTAIEALSHEAALRSRMGDSEGAEALEAGALDVAQRLLEAPPSAGDYQKVAGIAEEIRALAGGLAAAPVARCLMQCAALAEADPAIEPKTRTTRASAYLAGAKAILGAVSSDPIARPVEALNRAAWFLLTAADARLRDAAQARVLIESALRREPDNGDYWNTLALALVRLKQWDRAIAAESKALPGRQGGNPYDWYILALAKAKLGMPAEASAHFAKAEAWTRQHPNEVGEDLDALRVEANEALALSAPKP